MHAGSSGDLSMYCRRYMEEDRSHQTTLDSTPRCAAGSVRAPGNCSGTPSRKAAPRSKSTSKTPSERVRWPLPCPALSDSAVAQDLRMQLWGALAN